MASNAEPQAGNETKPRNQEQRPQPLALMLVPTVIVLAIFVGGIGVLGYPAELMLILSGVVFSAFAIWRGAQWDEIIATMGDRIKKALPAILILFMIGMLIGTWMISGTIPLLVFYGLEIINPSYLFLLTFITTAIVATFTGTSWGAAGTIGVALMGVAATMDVSLAVTAGAVVSGAYFGDKMSPLSDTTNMSAIAAGANLYDHIRHMLFTTIPASILAMIVYFFVGRSIDTSSLQLGNVKDIIDELSASFSLNPVLLLPPVVVLVGSLLKKSPVVVLFLSSMLALVLALVVQRARVSDMFDAAVSGFTTDMLPQGGDASEQLTTLLERGGLYSMYNATFFIFAAFFFAAALGASNVLQALLEPIVSRLKSTGSLVATTLVSGFAIVSATSNALITYFLLRDLFGDAYRKHKLHPVNLSRSMEDSATLTEVLMPWTVSGVFFATTLGVGNFAFLPWAITNWSGFLFSALIAILAPVTKNFGIRLVGEKTAIRHKKEDDSDTDDVAAER